MVSTSNERSLRIRTGPHDYGPREWPGVFFLFGLADGTEGSGQRKDVNSRASLPRSLCVLSASNESAQPFAHRPPQNMVRGCGAFFDTG